VGKRRDARNRRGAHVRPKPSGGPSEERQAPVALVELLAGQASLGTWLVSFGRPQGFVHDQKTYVLEMRWTRFYTPFSLTLLQTTHEVYPGTDIPKNFQSRVRIDHPEKREVREVDIYMNNPLAMAVSRSISTRWGAMRWTPTAAPAFCRWSAIRAGLHRMSAACWSARTARAVPAHLAGFVRERRTA